MKNCKTMQTHYRQPNWPIWALILIVALILFSALSSRAEPGRHELIPLGDWNAYVYTPGGYANNNILYPAIIFFPGIGEVGNNAPAVIQNGPGAYIQQGWDGSVTVEGETVQFIVVSIQPLTSYPHPELVKQYIDALLMLYRIDPARLNFTGLSHGAWVSNIFATYKPAAGNFSFMDRVKTIVNIQGVTPGDTYGATSTYPGRFTEWAGRGGKELGIEQSNDPRDIQTITNAMGSRGFYVRTSFGSGAHCCWNMFYGGQGQSPQSFMIAGRSQTIYEWIARENRLGVVPIEPTPQEPPTTRPEDFTVDRAGMRVIVNVDRAEYYQLFNSLGQRVKGGVLRPGNNEIRLKVRGVYYLRMETKKYKFLL